MTGRTVFCRTADHGWWACTLLLALAGVCQAGQTATIQAAPSQAATPQAAHQQFATGPFDLADVPFETLLETEVISASRLATQVSQAHTAVSVVTAEDIRAHGYRTLADVVNSAQSQLGQVLQQPEDENTPWVARRRDSRCLNYYVLHDVGSTIMHAVCCLQMRCGRSS